MSHRRCVGARSCGYYGYKNHKDSASIAEASRQVPADISEPLYPDAGTLQIVMAEALQHGRLETAPRGGRQEVAAATFRRTCDEGGFLADDCHVLRCGPDIFRDPIGNVEGLDAFTHAAEQSFGFVCLFSRNDD